MSMRERERERESEEAEEEVEETRRRRQSSSAAAVDVFFWSLFLFSFSSLSVLSFSSPLLRPRGQTLCEPCPRARARVCGRPAFVVFCLEKEGEREFTFFSETSINRIDRTSGNQSKSQPNAFDSRASRQHPYLDLELAAEEMLEPGEARAHEDQKGRSDDEEAGSGAPAGQRRHAQKRRRRRGENETEATKKASLVYPCCLLLRGLGSAVADNRAAVYALVPRSSCGSS